MSAQESAEEAPPQSSSQPTPSCWAKSAKFVISGSILLLLIVIIVVTVVLLKPGKGSVAGMEFINGTRQNGTMPDVILPREREYWNAFQKTDKNGDAKLNYEEYKEYVAILNANRDQQLSPEMVTNVFFHLDKNGDKDLIWDEAKKAGS